MLQLLWKFYYRDREMTDPNHKCKNCFHRITYLKDPTKGWCGNSNSPYADKDISMEDTCDEWNKREPFEWLN